MKIALIVAAANNNVIGINNRLPWHLPEDLRYFKAVTMGKPIVMGRKTYESIGKPLPGRLNIVMTRQAQWQAEGVCVAHNFEDARLLAEAVSVDNPTQELMIIGGADLYAALLDKVEKIYLTRVDMEPEGDAFFPEVNLSEWSLVSEQAAHSSTGLMHRFEVYERATNPRC